MVLATDAHGNELLGVAWRSPAVVDPPEALLTAALVVASGPEGLPRARRVA